LYPNICSSLIDKTNSLKQIIFITNNQMSICLKRFEWELYNARANGFLYT